jgi:hypothetical protein
MPDTLLPTQAQFRVLHRQSVRSEAEYQVRQQRASLLDPNLRGDAWIEVQRGERLALCFAARRLAFLAGCALDLPSLNLLLDRLRHRYPRRRCPARPRCLVQRPASSSS